MEDKSEDRNSNCKGSNCPRGMIERFQGFICRNGIISPKTDFCQNFKPQKYENSNKITEKVIKKVENSEDDYKGNPSYFSKSVVVTTKTKIINGEEKTILKRVETDSKGNKIVTKEKFSGKRDIAELRPTPWQNLDKLSFDLIEVNPVFKEYKDEMERVIKEIDDDP